MAQSFCAPEYGFSPMQEFTLSSGRVESGEIPFICDCSVISRGSGDTQLCLNLHFGELYWLSAYKCLHIYMSFCRHIRDVKSNNIKKRSRGVMFFWRKRKVWCARLLLLCAQLWCSAMCKRTKHGRVLSMAHQGNRNIAWFKEEYCVSTHLVWGTAKSEAFQFQLWKCWVYKDLLSLSSDAQVQQATGNARDARERNNTKLLWAGSIQILEVRFCSKARVHFISE